LLKTAWTATACLRDSPKVARRIFLFAAVYRPDHFTSTAHRELHRMGIEDSTLSSRSCFIAYREAPLSEPTVGQLLLVWSTLPPCSPLGRFFRRYYSGQLFRYNDIIESIWSYAPHRIGVVWRGATRRWRGERAQATITNFRRRRTEPMDRARKRTDLLAKRLDCPPSPDLRCLYLRDCLTESPGNPRGQKHLVPFII
jgi:hypothetical protein